jgi:hypothetical protein
VGEHEGLDNELNLIEAKARHLRDEAAGLKKNASDELAKPV